LPASRSTTTPHPPHRRRSSPSPPTTCASRYLWSATCCQTGFSARTRTAETASSDPPQSVIKAPFKPLERLERSFDHGVNPKEIWATATSAVVRAAAPAASPSAVHNPYPDPGGQRRAQAWSRTPPPLRSGSTTTVETSRDHGAVRHRRPWLADPPFRQIVVPSCTHSNS